MRRVDLFFLALLATAALLASCGGGGGSDKDVDTTETTETDQAETDPCEGIVNSCTAVGLSCDGNELVTCAANPQGCLVATSVDCAADDQICDDTGDEPVCADAPDPCDGISDCDAEGRSCDGDTLVVCAPDTEGCLVEARRRRGCQIGRAHV